MFCKDFFNVMQCVSVYYNVVPMFYIFFFLERINRVRLIPDAPARMDTPDRPPTDLKTQKKRKRNRPR